MNTVGVVLAAGASRRLRPHSDGLPKTLVPITPGAAGPSGSDSATEDTRSLTPLDVILQNFARSGVTEVTIVVGYAAAAVRQRVPDLERTHQVEIRLIHNERAETWNNCYSLWCARSAFDRPVLLCNGDTVHHAAVEQALLESDSTSPVVLAVDIEKHLGHEEMKVDWSATTGVQRIEKGLDPAQAYGEYIGLAMIRPEIGEDLAAALEHTWSRDPTLYYEDGFVELIRRGAGSASSPVVDAQPIGQLPWIEIDDHDDLARAATVVREIV